MNQIKVTFEKMMCPDQVMTLEPGTTLRQAAQAAGINVRESAFELNGLPLGPEALDRPVQNGLTLMVVPNVTGG